MNQEFDKIVNEFKKASIALPDQWWDDKKAEFIYNSNKLEGNRLQLVDTYSIINDKLNFSSEARFKDVLEVKGHIKAVDTCIFMARNKYPLTDKTLKSFNENLLSALWKFDEYYSSWKQNKQELGAYKIINNSIKYILGGEEGIIEPVSNTVTVEENMKKVFNEMENISDVLERSAYLAYQVWLNQPFPDGNKRTARLSVAYSLLLEGLPLISFKAEGYHFNEGLLRSHKEKSLLPLINVISTEVKQQLTEIMELDKKLKINKTPPNLGLGSSLLF
ncbi:MAG: Fic family protein [Bacteroidota bacterium]|nr:Fic family protein [Bacteroidota bacterium]